MRGTWGKPRGARTTVRRLGVGLVAATVLAAAWLVPTPLPARAAGADPCAAPVTNPIPCENSKPGTPASEWQNLRRR